MSKTIANLERVGDEAARIARTVQRLINTGVSSRMRLPVADLVFEAELATAQLRKALNSTARYIDPARFGAFAQGNGLINVPAAWELLKTNKKWWLAPIILALIAIGVLVIALATKAAPLIYPLL